MKHLLTGLIFAISFNSVIAQEYAVINDKDGYVNIRKSKSISSKVVGKIYNDDVFIYYSEDQSNGWIKVYVERNDKKSGQLLNGYIYQSRLTALSTFKRIKKLIVGPDSAVVQSDSLKVVVKSSLFNLKNHKLTYYKSVNADSKNNQHVLLKIDGKQFWGTDGTVPKKVVSAVSVNINGTLISIPNNQFNDLYEPVFKTLNVYLDSKGSVFIEMDNSDGAGRYSSV